MAASSERLPQPAGNTLCPGCQSAEALLLPCGHHLCQDCLTLCQGELGQEQAGCTECYGKKLLDSVLKGLMDSLFQGQPRRAVVPQTGEECVDQGQAALERCSTHGENLTRFCTDDEELVCEVCLREGHEGHDSCCTDEAAQDCKRELRSALRPLQEMLEVLNTAKQSCEETTDYIKSQARHTERLIKEEFEKLRQFLGNEEAAALNSLKEEEEQKTQKMKEQLDKLAGEIASLADTINSAEEAMDTDDVTFLKNYIMTSERTECRVQKPDEVTDTLIDVANHLGCIKFHVWDKMQTIIQYTPVVLDPNTADICLMVSDDLTTVHYSGEDQALPDNPERFSYYECVLGSEGYNSGRHCWDVEVGDCSEWALGVVSETMQRKEWFPPNPERGLWTICLFAGEYHARTTSSSSLTVKKKPHRVRVQLDYERGRLTFSDASDNTLLYKFKHKFTETVYPYFSNTCKRHPLRILTGKLLVIVD
ncbi:nuclear factor 7, brain [Denticeps clupeoides]|uniref:Zinc-binding protein A33-like n=1 Tax=Denticeps clupeoides TaxID=299321 RepID=A0AAY4B644_9TELE|nr:nuclear factor 7, brain-like [Denticeps clupeoides]